MSGESNAPVFATDADVRLLHRSLIEYNKIASPNHHAAYTRLIATVEAARAAHPLTATRIAAARRTMELVGVDCPEVDQPFHMTRQKQATILAALDAALRRVGAT